MDTDSPENRQILLQSLQIDLRVAEFRAEEYRRLLLSVIGQGAADATTQIRTDPHNFQVSRRLGAESQAQPSSSTAGDPGRSSGRSPLAPAPVPASSSTRPPTRPPPRPSARPSASAPARPLAGPERSERSIRTSRRAAQARVLASPRPMYARTSHYSHSLTPTDFCVTRTQRPTLSQTLSNRYDESEGTSTHVSEPTSTSSSHENDDANDASQPVFPVAVEEILSRANITSFRLSWGEQERANSTPRVSQATISRIFGSRLCLDWVKCQGDKHFFYAKPKVQPFGPTSIGGPGLALLGPACINIHGPEEGLKTTLFHVFMAASVGEGCAPMTPMKYMGDYAMVPLQQHIDWSLLPWKVRSSCFILHKSDVIPGSAKKHGLTGCLVQGHSWDVHLVHVSNCEEYSSVSPQMLRCERDCGMYNTMPVSRTHGVNLALPLERARRYV